MLKYLVLFVSSSAFALPAKIICHNETRTTAYVDIAVEQVMSSDNVMFSRMTITKGPSTKTDWVDGPSSISDNISRTYYGDNLIFTVNPDGEAQLKLIDVHEDGSFTTTLERYTCEGAR